MDADKHKGLAQRIVSLRDEVHAELKRRNLIGAVHRFDPDSFNPTVPLGGNLLYASPRRSISQTTLATEKTFLGMIAAEGLAEQAIAISQTLVETLHQTFGMDGTKHPLFTALGIEEALYEQLVEIANRRRTRGDGALSEEEFSLLMTVPFAFTAEQIGPAFPESFKDEILAIRRTRGEQLRKLASEMFVPVDPKTYLPRLTLLENLIYGRMSNVAGVEADLVVDAVSDVLTAHDMRREVAANVFDVHTAIGGTNMPPAILERAAFTRASIKRPDILIFDKALQGSDLAAVRMPAPRMTCAESSLSSSITICLARWSPAPSGCCPLLRRGMMHLLTVLFSMSVKAPMPSIYVSWARPRLRFPIRTVMSSISRPLSRVA